MFEKIVNWNDMRIDTALSEFETYLRYEKGRSQATIDTYLFAVKELIGDSFKGNAKVTSINKKHVIEYLNKQIVENSAATRNNRYYGLKCFFDWLEENNNIRKNPIGKIGHIKNLTNKEPIFMTEDEIKSYLKEVDLDEKYYAIRNKAIIYLFLFTGMRKSEILNLNNENINFKDKEIKFVGKGNKERIVPIHPELKKRLVTYKKWKENKYKYLKNEAFFISAQRKRLSKTMYNRIVKKYAKKAGIKKDISPHKLRHSFASLFYKKTKDIETLREILGHSSLETTQIYMHTDKEEKRKKINSIQLN